MSPKPSAATQVIALQLVRLELAAVAGVEVGDVGGVVVLVEAGAVALRGVARLGQQVQADDRLDADGGELLADHAVAGAEVQRLQRRGSMSAAMSSAPSSWQTICGESHSSCSQKSCS